MPLDENDRREGYKAMERTLTAAGSVRRSMRAGRQRKTDEPVDAETAVLFCRMAFVQMRRAMLREGIGTTISDARVGLAMIGPDNASNFIRVVPIGRGTESLIESEKWAVEFEKSGMLPLGILFWQRDREEQAMGKPGRYAWMQPWLVNDRARAGAFAANAQFLLFQGSEGADDDDPEAFEYEVEREVKF